MSVWNWFKKTTKKTKGTNQTDETTSPIHENLEATIKELEHELGESSDIVIRRFTIGASKRTHAALMYTDGLVNTSEVNQFLKVLLLEFNDSNSNQPTTKIVKEQLLNIGNVNEFSKKVDILNEILRGSTAILIEGAKTALIADTKGWETRGVTEPNNQLVLRGPREGFTENIRTNTALIRRIVSSTKLRLEEMKLGTLSETTVGIMYIEGVAHEKVINEMKKRLKQIKMDSVVGTGYLEDFLSDNPWSLFPQVMYVERPDTTAGQLFEGKVVVLLEGTPFVLIAPVTLYMFFQSADDYYLRWQLSSFLRILRMVTFVISATLPSLYVAITTFHQELIPTTLLYSLASQREGVPFPAFIEALIMELTFEVLREAGVRMPRAIGQAVSIVGALVLGTTAVEAGIVSSAMVIIVSMTAISTFTAPYIDIVSASRLIRFFLLVLAATFGLFGILFGIMFIIIHLTGLRSFGIPYLKGLAPFNLTDQKDLLIRVPWFYMKSRPRLFGQKNPIRQDSYVTKPPKARQRKRRSD